MLPGFTAACDPSSCASCGELLAFGSWTSSMEVLSETLAVPAGAELCALAIAPQETKMMMAKPDNRVRRGAEKLPTVVSVASRMLKTVLPHFDLDSAEHSRTANAPKPRSRLLTELDAAIKDRISSQRRKDHLRSCTGRFLRPMICWGHRMPLFCRFYRVFVRKEASVFHRTCEVNCSRG